MVIKTFHPCGVKESLEGKKSTCRLIVIKTHDVRRENELVRQYISQCKYLLKAGGDIIDALF